MTTLEFASKPQEFSPNDRVEIWDNHIGKFFTGKVIKRYTGLFSNAYLIRLDNDGGEYVYLDHNMSLISTSEIDQ